MKDLFINLRSMLRPTDALDILVVAFIVYRTLLLIRGTRAMQMATGLMILGIGFYLSSVFELFATHYVFSYFFDYLILIVIVLFQDDFRRALTYVGKNPFFASASAEKELEMIDDVARASILLAKAKIGALIVIERETGLKNFIDTGSPLDSTIKAELLYALFIPSSPLHDGAAIITGGKIAAAGCFLPLSKDPNIDKRYGSRHRAALGITEDSDAIVVLVSEEAGEAHLVKNGKITTNLSEEELRMSLRALLNPGQSRSQFPERIWRWLQSTETQELGHEED